MWQGSMIMVDFATKLHDVTTTLAETYEMWSTTATEVSTEVSASRCSEVQRGAVRNLDCNIEVRTA